MSVHRRLARAIKTVARDNGDRAATGVQLAEVTSTKPLEFDLLEADIQLLDEEYVLTQWVKRYDDEIGIDEEDVVIVIHKAGQWIVADVLSDKVV